MIKKYNIFFILIFLFIMSGCTKQNSSTSNNETKSITESNIIEEQQNDDFPENFKNIITNSKPDVFSMKDFVGKASEGKVNNSYAIIRGKISKIEHKEYEEGNRSAIETISILTYLYSEEEISKMSNDEILNKTEGIEYHYVYIDDEEIPLGVIVKAGEKMFDLNEGKEYYVLVKADTQLTSYIIESFYELN